MKGNNRVWILDILRGFAIIMMVLHHSAFSYYYTFNGKFDLYTPFLKFAPLFVCIFFSISGICTIFSRSNLKRGIKTLICAIVISLVTYIAGPSYFIVFGVIHCFAVCMLIHAIFGRYLDRFAGKWTPVVYLSLFSVSSVFTGMVVNIPHLYMFGFVDAHFRSADYYPIFPWLFMYLFGSSVSSYVAEGKMPQWFYTVRCRPLEWVGRHALIIYLAHQPIILGTFYIAAQIFK